MKCLSEMLIVTSAGSDRSSATENPNVYESLPDIRENPPRAGPA